MDEADQSIAAYEKLYNSVPSIGFLSRKKRVFAFLKITKMTQQMIDNQDISEEQALYLLSILVRKCARFQKAAMMVALNLASINRKHIEPIGFRYANEMRCSLQMLPVNDEMSSQP